MKFWDEHEAQRDKFAILAIHNQRDDTDTFEKLDKILEERGQIERWGRNLPFTVILDNTRETTTTYGIRFYPTHVLIDPEGKIVEGGTLTTLQAKLAEMKKAEGEE